MERLRKRPEFLAAARGVSRAMPGLVMQARDRGDDGPARIGFTVTRKIGNAVVRNRARRRLREAARLTLEPLVRPGFDYVVIARAGTIARPFESLRDDLRRALDAVHAAGPKGAGAAGPHARSRPTRRGQRAGHGRGLSQGR